MLKKYIHQIGKTNPGSFRMIKKIVEHRKNTSRIKRMLLSFVALKKGFLSGCKLFIRVDDFHVKG